MKRTWKTVAFSFVLAASVGAWAGSLVVGTPEINGNKVTVPVSYDDNGAQEGVSALDFRFNYDPNVFSPAGVDAGSAASQANKQVQYNVVKEGEMAVIVMGMNQNEIRPDEVAVINLELVGNGAAAESSVSVTKTTLASPLGLAQPSQGSTGTIKLSSYTEPADDDGSDTAANDDTSSNTEDATETPDVTQPSKDSQDDMQVAQNESDADDSAAASAVSLPQSSRSGSSSSSQRSSAASAVPVASTPEQEGSDPSKSLSQLAAATNTARNIRESLPTPSAQDDGRASSGAPRPATPGSPAQPGDKPLAGTSTPPTAAGEAGPDASVDSQDLTMAKAESSTADGASPTAPATQPDDSAAQGEVAKTPKQSPVKYILLAVMAAVLVAVFFVRRRLFS